MDALYCGFCLVVRKDDLSRAVTIINGQACCFDHMYYVQGNEFNRILAIIKSDEQKKEGEKWKDTVKQVEAGNEELRKGIKRLGRLRY